MRIQTSRFGALEIDEKDVVNLPEGILGFEELKTFCIVDPSDETMILWLQSTERAEIAFPILEPKIYRPDYIVRLSASELRALELTDISTKETLVYNILTIPEDPRRMTANLKAPIVINIEKQLGRQVVLQENEYSIKCSIYKELISLMMSAQKGKAELEPAADVMNVKNIKSNMSSARVEVTSL